MQTELGGSAGRKFTRSRPGRSTSVAGRLCPAWRRRVSVVVRSAGGRVTRPRTCGWRSWWRVNFRQDSVATRGRLANRDMPRCTTGAPVVRFVPDVVSVKRRPLRGSAPAGCPHYSYDWAKLQRGRITMKNDTGGPSPSTAQEGLQEALLRHGWKRDNQPMTDVPHRILLSRQQAQRLECTGSAALAPQTVSPTGKQLEQRRILTRGSHRGTRMRARGAGRPAVRGASKRSSARSGDSGDHGLGEPDEPSEWRRPLCAHCGDDLPVGRRDYCKDQCSAAARKRRQREREREWAKRTAVARIPKLDGSDEMHKLAPWEYDRLLSFHVCRCNGSHLELFRDGWCDKCGHPLPDSFDGGRKRYRSFVARLVREAEEREALARLREEQSVTARHGAVVE